MWPWITFLVVFLVAATIDCMWETPLGRYLIESAKARVRAWSRRGRG